MSDNSNDSFINIKQEIEVEYNCYVCNQGFTFEYELKEHRKKHEKDADSNDMPPNVIKIEPDPSKARIIDSKESPCEATWIKKEVPDPEDTCAKNKKSKKKKIKSQKRKKNSSKQIYYCDKCPKIYQNRRGILGHVKSHCAGYIPFSCDSCGSSFSRKCNLMLHNRKYHLENSTGKSQLKSVERSQINVVEEQPAIICSDCQRTFRSQKLLKLHKRVHSIIPESLKCCKCERVFQTVASFRRHELVHTNLRNYSCPVCQTQFKHKSSYKKHKATVHSTERPFSCDQCDQNFKLNSILKMHYQRAHSNVRSHTCLHCEKSFKTRSDWTAHQQIIHFGTKCYQCNSCEKSFKTKGDLNVHQVSHSELRPHICEYCNSTYKSTKSLKVHQKKHCSSKKANSLNSHVHKKPLN